MKQTVALSLFAVSTMFTACSQSIESKADSMASCQCELDVYLNEAGGYAAMMKDEGKTNQYNEMSKNCVELKNSIKEGYKGDMQSMLELKKLYKQKHKACLKEHGLKAE